MEGLARNDNDQSVPVTLTRDDIEKGRAIFLMTRTGYDGEDDFPDGKIDLDAIEPGTFGGYIFGGHKIFEEPDSDIWLVPVEGSDPIGYRYSIDRVNNILTYETKEGLRTLEGNEFAYGMQSAVRVDETGRMICQFSRPLEIQEKLCEEAGAADHLAEIEQDFELMKRSPDGYDRGRAYTRDINKIAPDEEYSDELISERRRNATETMVQKAELNDRMDAEWDILLNNEFFKNAQVRGIFNHFMSTRLKDFPMDQVGIARFQNLEEATQILRDAFPEHRECEPFDGGSVMRGYRTSTVHEFTDGKMTVITFSDLPDMPVHAYAYPNELTLDADVAPDSPAPAF